MRELVIPATGGVVAPVATAQPRPHPARRWQTLALAATWLGFAVVLALGALAPLLRTGDAHQYYAMALNLAAGEPPALTPAQADAYKAWLIAQPVASNFPGGALAIDQARLVVDGRQEFSHFWLYPALAAPFVAMLQEVGAPVGYAFLIVNAVLLALALWQVQVAYSAVVSLLLLASPLVWFINKAQVESLTVALLAVAMAQAGRGRWSWAALAAAVAATQNIPILAATLCFWGAGLLIWGRTRPRSRPGVGTLAVMALTGVVALAHPAYYWLKFGVATPQQLNNGIGEAPATMLSRYLAVLIDPDVGLLAWLPLHAALAAVGFGLIWWWPRRVTGGVVPVAGGSAGMTLTSPSEQRGGFQGAHPASAPRGGTKVTRGGLTKTEVPAGTELASRAGAAVARSLSDELATPVPEQVRTDKADRTSAVSPMAPAPALPDGWAHRRLAGGCGLGLGVWFVLVFAQTTNINSGGTVHVSRYALWLLPLMLPFLATAAAWLGGYLPGLLPVTGVVALAIYGAAFRPAQAEFYVDPSPQSAAIALLTPELYRPVPEIFAERYRHQDGGIRGSAALPSCRLILLAARDQSQPCALTGAEQQAADALLAGGWSAVWISRPGPFTLAPGEVRGAVPAA